MKLKSLLFGSAALVAAGTGAQAADLPAPEPVEYVRICDAFGTGFYYIPGTDTCLRISGRVRVESHTVDDFDDNVFVNREFNNWTTRARGNVRLDARTQTDFGLVRAFIEYQLTVGPSNFATNYDSANPDLVSAFIQISRDWLTYTAGHTSSFFDFWGSNTFGTRVGIDDNTTEQTLFAWTLNGGNGFSATLSIEDPASSGRRLNPGTAFVGLEGGPDVVLLAPLDNYEGQEYPDVVGNLRIDQGWGSAQVMGVIHHVHDKEGFEVVEGADDADGIGWAVGAGLNLNLPFFGLGFNSQGGYSEGAIGYITGDPASRSYFYGISSGDFIGPDAEDSLTQAWMVRAGITGDFSPTIGFSIDGSYTEIDTDSQRGVISLDVDPGAGVTLAPAIYDGIDYQFWGVAGNVTWEPVSGLLFGWEVAYNNLELDEDTDETGLLLGEDELDVWGAMFRVQRDF